MGLLIKKETMPLSCEKCFAYDDDTKMVPFCRITKDQIRGENGFVNRLPSCPLVSLPQSDYILDYFSRAEPLGDCESFIQHFMD